MQKRIVRKDEQIKLIMECRQSGLSDYQWCQRQDINAGTFYNWFSKLHVKMESLIIIICRVIKVFNLLEL